VRCEIVEHAQAIRRVPNTPNTPNWSWRTTAVSPAGGGAGRGAVLYGLALMARSGKNARDSRLPTSRRPSSTQEQAMKEIDTEIIIDAPPERVWQVLTDFASYPEWNPFIREARGELEVGKRLSLQLALGKRTIPIKPELVRVEPNRALVWRGSLPIPGLFTGEHAFELEPQGASQTRLRHHEKFNGLLVRVLGKVLAETKRNFEQMNVALDRRATTE
jgi:hypothetical protein